MKAIIHIGMPKTGTSSIQMWMHLNQAALQSENVHTNNAISEGFQKNPGKIKFKFFKYMIDLVMLNEYGIDERTVWPHGKSTPNGYLAKIHRDFNIVSKKLEKLARESGTLILSQEVLYRHCSKIHIMALDKYLLRFFDERIYVIYIRESVDFLSSMYSQKLKNFHRGFHDLEFSEFLELCAHVLAPFGSESSFEKLFDWSNVLGEKLNVRLLESDWLVKGDLIEDFASLAGVSTFEKPSRMNESFAAEYIEYVRYLNREFGTKANTEIILKAYKILNDLSFRKPKLSASDAQANSIRDLHCEQEERIRKKFFPDRPFLFTPKVRDNGTAPVPLTESRMTEIESEIQKKWSQWAPHELVGRKGSSTTGG